MVKKQERKLVSEEIRSFYAGKAVDMIIEMKTLIDKYGDSVCIQSIYSWGDEYLAYCYMRPETDQEFDKRVREEEAQRAKQEEFERKQFDLLKAKYA